MTPQAQRIACAEMEGWRDIDDTHKSGNPVGISPIQTLTPDSLRKRAFLPDYLNDANAALRLLRHLMGEGWWWKMEPTAMFEIRIRIWSTYNPSEEFTVVEKTIPLAIVTAALRATGRDSTGEGR